MISGMKHQWVCHLKILDLNLSSRKSLSLSPCSTYQQCVQLWLHRSRRGSGSYPTPETQRLGQGEMPRVVALGCFLQLQEGMQGKKRAHQPWCLPGLAEPAPPVCPCSDLEPEQTKESELGAGVTSEPTGLPGPSGKGDAKGTSEPGGDLEGGHGQRQGLRWSHHCATTGLMRSRRPNPETLGARWQNCGSVLLRLEGA